VHHYQDELRIATAEGLDLHLELAGLGSRFAARLVDLLLQVALLLLGLLASSLLGADLAAGVAALVLFALLFVYDVAFEVLGAGRTPGKRALALRVARADGRRVDLPASTIRNLIRALEGLPTLYVPAMVSILATARNQRLGDLAAATVVLHDARAAASPPLLSAHGFGAVPSVAPALDLTKVTAADVAAARAFLERRPGLQADVRSDLAARLAGALRPRVGGAVADLGDEALLEQVVRGKR